MPLATIQYSDFNINFQPHPQTGDLTLVKGINSIVQSVSNLVQTNHFERPFHSEIGGNIRALLFELVDPTTANLLAEEITDVLNNFEPRVSQVQVIVTSNITDDGYDVTVNFYITGVSTQISFSTFLERLR